MLADKQKKHILVNREGLEYYTVKGLEAVHEEMLRLLKIIDNIAKDNDIPYWIDGGSLIGVVRHKGFIPWDDDLDISLLKKDYLKLVKKISEYCEAHNDVSLFYDEPLDEHTCNFFAISVYYAQITCKTGLAYNCGYTVCFCRDNAIFYGGKRWFLARRHYDRAEPYYWRI